LIGGGASSEGVYTYRCLYSCSMIASATANIMARSFRPACCRSRLTGGSGGAARQGEIYTALEGAGGSPSSSAILPRLGLSGGARDDSSPRLAHTVSCMGQAIPNDKKKNLFIDRS
jgi:hypothetical protein